MLDNFCMIPNELARGEGVFGPDVVNVYDRAVYIYVRSHRKCTYSVASIAKSLGIGGCTVRKSLHKLTDLGYITADSSTPGAAIEYKAVDPFDLARNQDNPSATDTPSVSDSPSISKRGGSTTHRGTPLPDRGDPSTRESQRILIKNTNKENSHTNGESEKIETIQQTPGSNEHAWEDLDTDTEDGWEPYDPQNPPTDSLEAQTPTISQPQPERPSTPPRNASRGRYGFDPEDDRWERDMKFQQLISVYPRKQGVKEAYPAWKRAIRKTNATIIIGAAANFAGTVEDPRYAPMLGKWLDGERWLDQPLQPPKPKETQTYQSKDDQIAYWRERLDWMTERLKEQDAYQSREYAIECLEPPTWVIPYLR